MGATARAVDLTNVKEGGNFRPRRKPEGDYRAKIVKADDHQPKDKTKPMGWVLTIQIEGDARSTYPFYLNPSEKEVWKIGAICRAAGLNVKNAKVRFDPNKLVGKAIGLYLADDEYEGREKSSIDDVFPVSDVSANADEIDTDDDEEIIDDEVEIPEDEEEEEPEPAPKARTRRKPAPEPEDEEEEEEEEEEEPEPTPPPRKRAAARKRAPEPEPEDDEDEEEEPPQPRKRATRRKAAPPPEDDLDDLDLDDLDG